jgi:hypothetical protein
MTDNAFKFNNVLLSLQPTDHNWVGRNQYGISGDGHPIYPAVRQYQLKWSLSSASEFQEFLNAYNQVSVTGTLSVDLPEWNSATYQFRTYSGCSLTEPEFSNYYENYFQEVSLLVIGIRTV